jgi:hypothetical protein
MSMAVAVAEAEEPLTVPSSAGDAAAAFSVRSWL